MNLTKKRKILITVALTIVLLFCILLFLIDNKKQDLRSEALNNAKTVLNGTSHVKSDFTIYSKDVIDRTPLINYKYNLNGSNNEKYYNMLNYAAVQDKFEQTGLIVITAHDYSFFNKLHLIKLDNIIEIKDVKTNKINKYKVVKTLNISKNEGSMIYNTNLDPKKDIVLSTCVSGVFEGFEPSKRFVVYATQVN